MAVKSSTSKATRTYRISTGIPGLDSVLGGGPVGNRAYLIEGRPGTGENGRGR